MIPPNIDQTKLYIVIIIYGIMREYNRNKRKIKIPKFLFDEERWRIIVRDEIHCIRNYITKVSRVAFFLLEKTKTLLKLFSPAH
jgi:hypothetical protein